MKGLRKILSLVVASVMMFAMAATTALAAPTVPQSTSVTIHKIVGTGGFVLRDHNGGKLTPEQIAALGTNAVENNTGVEFTAWKVPAGTLVNAFNGMTDQQVTDSPLTEAPVLVTAGVAKSFATGTYYVRETKYPATLETQLGVPFVMELPALNVAGDAYLTELHLYPKNVIENDMPVIDKDVETKNQDNAGYDVGYAFDYLIYPKVPRGIEAYKTFKVSDTLASTLDYIGNVTVKYNGVTFLSPADYTLDEVKTAGGSFTLTFTAAGLQKLAASRPQTESLKDLEIKFQARINNTAAMGTNIYNNAVLTYNNGYTADQTTDVPLVNRPKVHTGGRKFVKVDNVTQNYLELLASAKFVVKNSEGKYMVKADNGHITWVNAVADATKLALGANGAFEVKGLAYGDNGEEFTYTLVEVVVPEGYVEMDDLGFTINASSYADSTAVTKVINVKRPVIPQTGGIGTIIFLASGLMLMGAAVVALKRKGQTEK